MSPSQVLKEILAQEASVTFPIKVNHMPDEPANLITLNDRANAVDGRAMNTGKTYFHPSIQAIFRASTYPEAYGQAIIVYNLLDTFFLKNVQVESVLYTLHSVTKQGTISSLGLDNKLRRSLVAFNFIICLKSTGV